MAVEPLYQTKEALLLKIRLGTITDAQTSAVVDTVISKARLMFFNRLTSTRALEIAGFADSDNPTTDDEILKSTAATAESTWVMADLILQLPTVLMASSDLARQNYNDDALSRDAFDLKKYRSTLLSQVEVLLGQLEIPVNEDTGPVKSFDAGRVEPFNIFGNTIGRPITL